jgi:hypothetical protein
MSARTVSQLADAVVASGSMLRGVGAAALTFILLACAPSLSSVPPPVTPTGLVTRQAATRDAAAQASLTGVAATYATETSVAESNASQTSVAAATISVLLLARLAATTAVESTAHALAVEDLAVRRATAAAASATAESGATSAAATRSATLRPPPTPANDATRSASATAVYWSKATAVATSRRPEPAPTFDVSRMVGTVDLDLPSTLGDLRRKLAADAHTWRVDVTETNCKGNLETLTADYPAIQATVYCSAGGSAKASDAVAGISVQAPFGGTLKGVSIGSTRADVTIFLRALRPYENFDAIVAWAPELDATIPAGRTGGPAGQHLEVNFGGSYSDFGEAANSVALQDARFTSIGISTR